MRTIGEICKGKKNWASLVSRRRGQGNRDEKRKSVLTKGGLPKERIKLVNKGVRDERSSKKEKEGEYHGGRARENHEDRIRRPFLSGVECSGEGLRGEGKIGWEGKGLRLSEWGTTLTKSAENGGSSNLQD